MAIDEIRAKHLRWINITNATKYKRRGNKISKKEF